MLVPKVELDAIDPYVDVGASTKSQMTKKVVAPPGQSIGRLLTNDAI